MLWLVKKATSEYTLLTDGHMVLPTVRNGWTRSVVVQRVACSKWACICHKEVAQINQRADIGDGASLELVDMFCYLGNMQSVDRNANAAVDITVIKRWNKFRQLVPLLINTDVSLLMRDACVTWQWNVASEEREHDGTSADWDQNKRSVLDKGPLNGSLVFLSINSEI